MRPLHIVVGVVAALALAGGGFAAGMTVARGAPTDATASASPSGAPGRPPPGPPPRPEAGTPGASPTVTSQIVLVGGSTRLVKTAETEIKLSDLRANDQVTIVGTTDASGNVSATAIVAGN